MFDRLRQLYHGSWYIKSFLLFSPFIASAYPIYKNYFYARGVAYFIKNNWLIALGLIFIHFFTSVIAESRCFLVPVLLVLLPMLLEKIEQQASGVYGAPATNDSVVC